VLGAGKAGGAMAAAVDALWPADAPLSGLVITRYDHVPPAYRRKPRPHRGGRRPRTRCPTKPGSSPPAHRGADAGASPRRRPGAVPDFRRRLGAAVDARRRPHAGRQAGDQQGLLKSGAAIDEMNCVRKHLSGIKGGRLAAMCAPARVVTLLISDVPGDAPEVIASGPTVPDASTCADALAPAAALRHHGAARRAGRAARAARSKPPSPVTRVLPATRCTPSPRRSKACRRPPRRRRAAGLARPHPQRRDRRRKPRGGQGARGAGACRGAARPAVCAALRDPVRRRDHGHRQGPGRPRGPATEFLLGCAIALQGEAGRARAGRPTPIEDNAGAIVTPDTLERARAQALKAEDHLDRNDAYRFFQPLGDLVLTGPTYTNVNDFRALLVL
jgi:glycerate 2-kinase